MLFQQHQIDEPGGRHDELPIAVKQGVAFIIGQCQPLGVRG